MKQMELAVKVAEMKYPPHIYKHVWVFDHSCGHKAFAPDTLVASRLNQRPGSKQPAMRDTVWGGKPPKGIHAKTNDVSSISCFVKRQVMSCQVLGRSV